MGPLPVGRLARVAVLVLVLPGCSRSPAVRAARMPAGPPVTSPADPNAGAPAVFLARPPGLAIERVYYRHSDPAAGRDGSLYVECLDLAHAKPGAHLTGRRLITLPGGESLDACSISPDGRCAALVVRSPSDIGNSDITNVQLADLANGRVRDLTTDWAGYSGPTWSSDGKVLVYVSAEGETEGTTLPPPDRPRKLPPWTVYCQTIPAGGRVRVFRQTPSDDTFDSVVGLTWLPGRRTLLYASVKPRGLFLLRADGGQPVLLTRRIPFDLDLASRRGGWLDPKTRTVSIFSLPSDPAALERPDTWRAPHILATLRLPNDPHGLVFSPDGSQVVVRLQRRVTDPYGMYVPVVDLRRRQVRSLGRIEPVYGPPRWSHDGRYLLWESYGQPPWAAQWPGTGPALLAVRADAAPAQPLARADWWRESGVRPTAVLILKAERAGHMTWVEAK